MKHERLTQEVQRKHYGFRQRFDLKMGASITLMSFICPLVGVYMAYLLSRRSKLYCLTSLVGVGLFILLAAYLDRHFEVIYIP